MKQGSRVGRTPPASTDDLPARGPEWYFINTDAKSLGGQSPHDLWFEHGKAFVGGDPRHGRLLQRPLPGDTLLMWVNGRGVVGVGVVTAPWDGRVHEDAVVYRPPHREPEYRLGVNWIVDLRSSPITAREIGSNPPSTLQRLLESRRDRVRGLIEKRIGAVFVEGGLREVTLTVHERNPEARAQCLLFWGRACLACDLDFEARFAWLGKGLIHVHHLTPLSTTAGPREVDPKTDLIPLCPNCHAMIHSKSPPMNLDELRGVVGQGAEVGGLESSPQSPALTPRAAGRGG